MFRNSIAACAAAILLCAPFAPVAYAEGDGMNLAETNGIVVKDGFARSSGAMAKAGAAFMTITNETGTDDVMVEARSDVAPRVELHTHIVTDGVARMVELEDGIPVAAGETVVLERGGMHVMFMGLSGGFEEGTAVDVTLVFETAGEIDISIPVDLMQGGQKHRHGQQGNSDAENADTTN